MRFIVLFIGFLLFTGLTAQSVNDSMGRREAEGRQAESEVQISATDGAQVRYVRNDVTDEPAIEALLKDIVSDFGRNVS